MKELIYGYFGGEKWLEDYKRLKSKKEQDIYERAYRDGFSSGFSDGHFIGYNKAIDKFAEKIKNSLLHNYNYNHSLSVKIRECACITPDFVVTNIEKVAEELKMGNE